MCITNALHRTFGCIGRAHERRTHEGLGVNSKLIDGNQGKLRAPDDRHEYSPDECWFYRDYEKWWPGNRV